MSVRRRAWSTTRRAWRRPMPWCSPASAPSARAPRALHESGLEDAGPRRPGGRRALLRCVRRVPVALRGLRWRARARPVSGSSAGEVAPLPPGVKHPQMQWNTLEVRGAVEKPEPLRGLGPRPWVYFVHSFAPPVGRRDGGGVRLRRRRGGTGHARAPCGARSSTRRSRGRRAWRSWPTSCAWPRRRRDGAVAGHRPACRHGGPAHAGRLRPRGALRRPGGPRGELHRRRCTMDPRRRPRRGPHGRGARA